MNGVMEGVRVLEVAQFTFVPAAGAVLADWGADVIKVEHAASGDAQRGLGNIGAVNTHETPRNMLMEHSNRGKRSIGLDLSRPEGRDVLARLAKKSDVFLTNFLPDARRKLRIERDDIRAHNPDIIYVRGSALGNKGPERESGGYDMTGFWCRAASASGATPKDLDGIIVQPAPGYGDSMGGMTIAGAISAALFHRERTGEAKTIDVSLLSTGLWAMGLAVDLSIVTGAPWTQGMPASGGAPYNPLVGTYRTSDRRHITFCMLQPGRYWADFCRHIDKPELIDDERFNDAEKLMQNSNDAAAIICPIIEARTFDYWCEKFATLEGQWAPVQDSITVMDDPQVRANDMIAKVNAGDGSTFELVNSPVQFDETTTTLERGPEFAEHTELVLLEAGLDWDQIEALKKSGVVA
jgi:crotonobetainyl-CoA:carnitine CoA-transferase CaiB-like acyl-CoA transferase